METVFGILIGLFVLMTLVVAHEYGHFILARRNGVKVLEFGVGFPPRAKAWVHNPEYIKWKANKKKAKLEGKDFDESRPKQWLPLPKSDWNKPQKTLVLSFNYLPIGGFCQMDGESDSDTKKGTFGAATLWGKTKILFGGVAMNWLVAWVVFTILAVTGMPNFMDNQFGMPGDTTLTTSDIKIAKVIENSPADKAGLKVGDLIYADQTRAFSYPSDIIEYNNQHAGETVDYCIKSEGEDPCHTVSVTLNDSDAEYRLGIGLAQTEQSVYRSTWSAPIVGAVNVVQLTGETYRGIWNALCSLVSGMSKQLSADEATRNEGQAELNTAGDSVTGPVGIIGYIFPNMISAGPTNIAFLAGLISISLACMNVLPIPALDGGRFTLIMLYRLRGKKLKKEVEEKIVARAFIVLLILMVLVTFLDITRFF